MEKWEIMNLKNAIIDYSKSNKYLATEFSELVCNCGSKSFNLYSDDDEGGAYAICTSCKLTNDIENSKKYAESPDQNICTCDHEIFSIMVGKSFYSESKDINWLYVGAQCPSCNLAGVYVDWNEK